MRIARARVIKPAAFVGALVLLVSGVMSAFAVDDSQFADDAFERTWKRTDKPVQDGAAARTWMWGNVLTGATQEPYAESPGGMRLVQYFDKARMEITRPGAVDDGLWYVTTGLLVDEMIWGQVQIGDAAWDDREPADVTVAGDPFGGAPTYAQLQAVRYAPPLADGATVTTRMDDEGNVTTDGALAGYGVTAAHRVMVPDIDHQIASVFWTFMNSEGPIWDGEQLTDDALFVNPFYATGYPLTDPYWSRVRVAGVEQDVLWQCFQRRCLTYTPENDPPWRVEAGNVGQHYVEWREDVGGPTPTATVTTTPGTATPTVTATATSTTEPVEDELLFVAELTGSGQAPDVNTDARGWAYVYLQTDGTLRYQIVVEQIEFVTAAHIHLGAPEAEGEVVLTLFDGDGAAVTPVRVLAEGELTAADLDGPLEDGSMADLADAIQQNNAYVNVHTSAYPDGEIRGQLALADDLLFNAQLSGDEEEPEPVETDATGATTLFYDADDSALSYQLTVEDIDDPTAAHIHLAPDDEIGDPVILLFASSEDDPGLESGVLAEGEVDSSDLIGPAAGRSLQWLVYEMLTGGTYVNVHTEDIPAGEIRGQLGHWTHGDGSVTFTAELAGNNEVPSVITDAGGHALITWNDDGTIDYDLIVHDLVDPMAAHIHLANEGQTGDVVVTLFLEDEPTGERNGRIAEGEIDAGDLSGPLAGASMPRLVYALATGASYVNVHTLSAPDGEIRGQVWPERGETFIAELEGDNEVPPVDSDAEGIALFFLRPDGESMSYDLIVSSLEDATAAHIHIAPAGDTGQVVVELWEDSPATPATENGLLASGTIDESALEGPLTGSQFADLLAQMYDDDTYVNVHTEENEDGEIRGQIEIAT